MGKQITFKCESKKSLAVHYVKNGGAAGPRKDAEMSLSRRGTTPVPSGAFKDIEGELSSLPP